MIADLKNGDEDAAAEIWERFFHRVTALADRKLNAATKRRRDEEDVALSAIDALCTGAREGRFRQLENRDDLWQILCMITSRKAALEWRRHSRNQEIGESVVAKPSDDLPPGMDALIEGKPDDRYLDSLTSTSRDLLEGLDEHLRKVAMLKLQGYRHDEVAEKIGRSVKAVERYLQTIREKWELQVDSR